MTTSAANRLPACVRVVLRRSSVDQGLGKPISLELNPALAQAEGAMLSSLSGKMLDLNRRPLNEKILTLADRWGAPLGDLRTGDALARAIQARNTIVHRGWYYGPVDGTPEQCNLWDHVLLMREIVIRFILTTLAFRGRHISFRGGQHDVAFPPSGRATAAAVQTERPVADQTGRRPGD